MNQRQGKVTVYESKTRKGYNLPKKDMDGIAQSEKRKGCNWPIGDNETN